MEWEWEEVRILLYIPTVFVFPKFSHVFSSAMVTGMMMGAATGLMIGAVARNKQNTVKHKDNKILVYQPFPGTLVVKHHKDHPAEFFTIASNEPIPPEVAVVLRPGQPGTPIQVTDDHGHHVNYSVIPPGQKIPHGDNVKIIVVKLAPGTLVQITQDDGTTVQAVFPPGVQIPPGSIVLRRPDGKPPAGTLVMITQPNGQNIQQIIPPGQLIPPGATVIPIEPEVTAKSVIIMESKKEKEIEQVHYPPPPTDASVSDVPSVSNYPSPPSGVIDDASSRSLENEHHHGISLEKSKPTSTGINLEKPAICTNIPPYAMPPASSVPSYAQPRDSVNNSNVPGYAVPPQASEYPPPPIHSQQSPYVQPNTNANLPQYGVSYPPAQPQYVAASNPPPVQQPPSNAGQRTSVTPKAQPPRWVADESSDHCAECKSPFTFFHRRHHCRNCGQLFCSDCSKHSIPLPHISIYTAERVCNACHHNVTS